MNKLFTIAIADTSVIIRNGLIVLLKHLPGIRLQVIEIGTADILHEALTSNKPDILIINPSLIGYLSLPLLKEKCKCIEMKCIALLYNIMDQSILNQYDEHFSIFVTQDELRLKLERLQTLSMETPAKEEQQSLSAREKEIVICVVKGMTNREIADKLFLSTHTVVTHRRNIARKLQVRSASGLTVYAIVNKLVKLNEVKL